MHIFTTSLYLSLIVLIPSIRAENMILIDMIEICDNGIDDDLDGLIDINDDDCQCSPIVPSGLIPNPSFENRSCCPQVKARLDCADNWIQASAATTDYVNTCGFLGNVIDAPLPIADGDGAIGLRDGSTNDGNYKEYAGACLSQPIEIGKSYKLQISVGFTNTSTSPSMTLTIFGNPSCGALPFGNNNASIGCPLNTPGWIEIGKTTVSGQDEWVETELDFTVNQNIHAVAIGPDCERRDQSANRYYFLDNLRLAETIDFGYQINVDGGNPCQSDYRLSLSGTAPGESYQWYREGIAIAGATQATYPIPNDGSRKAEYQVRIEDPSGCQITNAYQVLINDSSISQSDFTCSNTNYTFGSQQLTSSGLYTEIFLDQEGCDSTVALQLVFREENRVMIDTTICQGETYRLGNDVLSIAGDYTAILSDQYGCDSTVLLSLQVENPAASFFFQDQVIELGAEIILDLQGQEMNLQSYMWTSEYGEICADCPSQVILPTQDNTYILNAVGNNNCNIISEFNLAVDKNYKIFIPNVFSPNGDGVNDVFTIYPGRAVVNVSFFRVFDRWGNMLHESLNSLTAEWAGTHKGKKLNPENFVYIAEVLFIDGHTKTISGSVQLIR